MEIQGTYGNISKTECTIYLYDDWYAIEDSVNCNRCPDESLLVNGIDVDTIEDIDTFTASKPIESAEHLEAEVDDDIVSYLLPHHLSDDDYDLQSMEGDWRAGNFEVGDDCSEYAWLKRAEKNWVNGQKSYACEICADNGINPADIDPNFARYFIAEGYLL